MGISVSQLQISDKGLFFCIGKLIFVPMFLEKNVRWLSQKKTDEIQLVISVVNVIYNVRILTNSWVNFNFGLVVIDKGVPSVTRMEGYLPYPGILSVDKSEISW